MSIQGPTYLHILSPCPTGWRCPTDNVIEIGRLAVQTGVFPLYEVENGKYKLNYTPAELKPVSDYIKTQGRFRHLSENAIVRIQQKVDDDWAKLKSLAKK